MKNLQKSNSALYINISKVQTKEYLINYLAKSLHFPYFGVNWDSLNDCLTDLTWLTEKDIILIHHSEIELPPEEVKIYFSILKKAIDNWSHWEEHNFYVKYCTFEINHLPNYKL